MNSVSHPMDGMPVDVAISPDGTKVAYTFYGYECPVGASCGARTTTGIIPSDRFAATRGVRHRATSTRPPGSPTRGSSTRAATAATSTSRTSGPSPTTGSPTRRPTSATPRSRAPATSSSRCAATTTRRTSSGTRSRATRCPAPSRRPRGDLRDRRAGRLRPAHWAPDGNQVAWSEPDGIWIHRDAAGCDDPAAQARAARRLRGRLGPRERQPRAAPDDGRRRDDRRRRDRRRRRPAAAAATGGGSRRWRSR